MPARIWCGPALGSWDHHWPDTRIELPEADGPIPFAPLRVGKCWNADSRNEIDVVAIGGDGALLLRECIWGMVRPGDLKRLQARPI